MDFETSSTASEAWIELINDVIEYGEYSGARKIDSVEIINYTSEIDMNFPIVNMPSRGMNYKFMFGEAWWILSGSNRVSDITQFMKAIHRFSDNGYSFRGAYGPKVIEQLDYVVEKLKQDMYSRQALLTIWRENPRESKDIPCTISLQFLIRNNRLHCIANMRSSDSWLGWVYDVFNFSMISLWVLVSLKKDFKLGRLFINAGSQHLYHTNIESAKKILTVGPVKSNIPFPLLLETEYKGNPDNLVKELFGYAKMEWENE